ncbi:MAG: hypothetical protein P8L18_06095 [Verrucomicrobiota bacterium]|jgi:hypothetical protein|nr:hypothetical protein [Verrucomicrobiota bacterium]
MKIFKRTFATAFALIMAVNTQADHHEEAAPSSPTEVPLELRMKAARKPNNIIQHWYLEVAEANEARFEALLRKMLPVFQQQVTDGIINGWGLAKARENALNADYMVWVLSDDIDHDQNHPFEKNYLDNIHGKQGTMEIWKEMFSLMQFQGRDISSLSAYTLMDLHAPKWPDSHDQLYFRIDYAHSDQQAAQAYERMEREVFQPRWQKWVDINPVFMAWNFLKVEGSSGNFHDGNFRTLQIFRKDIAQSEAEMKKHWETLPGMPEGYLKDLGFESVGDLREMKEVTYDIVMATDGSKSAKNRILMGLLGSWKHVNEDGSYRTKVITPFAEQVSFFNSKGEVLEKREPAPFRVEIVDGQPRFTVYSPDGTTWNAAIDLKDGKWFEQHRAKVNGKWTVSDPDVFWIYERMDNTDAAQ